MTNEKQNDLDDFLKMSYELAKAVSKMSDIYSRMNYIIEKNSWDGLYMCDFSEALAKMANVISGALIYSIEDKYVDDEIHHHEACIEALKEHS